MFDLSSQPARLGIGDLDGGPGIAGYTSWIIAFVVLLVLAALARWMTHPARRAARAQRRTGDPGPVNTQAAGQHDAESTD
ncbi:MAG: hypothetical protein WBP61_14035 [Nocardioides sp.]